MQITTHTDHALRMLIYLHVHGQETPASVSEVADAYKISVNHLAKVAQTLAAAGWINTQRGRGGGITLDASVYDVTIGDIFRHTEKNCELVECFLKNNDCVIDSSCGLKHALRKAYDAFLEVLDEYHLNDLVRQPNKLRTLLTINTT